MSENAQTFHFELVSPERKLISEAAAMAVIPGEEGNIGVLPNHSALVASVRPGVVEVFASEGAAPQRIFIAGGFADISAENCTLLAEQAVNVNDLDEAQLRKALDDLNEDLGMVEGDADKMRVAREIALTRAKLEALTGQIVL